MTRRLLAISLMVTLPLSAQQATAPAAADSPDSSAVATSEPAAMPSLVEHLPDYSGDWWSRKFLTGDWGGARTDLANNGILFDLSLTQIGQGNAHGGKDTNDAFRYAGSVDYTLRLDTARMKLWPGGLITLRGETSFGKTINSKSRAILSPNYDALFPVPNDPGVTTLSEYYIAQALSEKFVLLAGKIDLSTGDANEFAHDEHTQFLNTAFRINPVLFSASPYTAMALGAIFIPTEWLTIGTFVADNDPDGAVRKTGFNTAFHDRTWLSVMQEYTFTWKPFEKPGHQRFGWFWTSRDFTDFGGDSRLSLSGNTVSLAPRRMGPFSRSADRFSRNAPGVLRSRRFGDTVVTTDGPDKRPDDWGIYYNFDQYFYTEADDPKQGWGLFGRFGWSTGEANIIEEFYSIGVGGKGAIPLRDRDTCGVGYYMANFTDDLRQALDIDAEQGVEVYYNIEVTPWLHITPDLQVIVDPGGGFRDRDVAIVYGLRAQMSF